MIKASRMYRMPEKQTECGTVSNCARSNCFFYQYANLLIFISILVHLHFANYPASGRFNWRQKCCLQFLRCLPLWAPFLF